MLEADRQQGRSTARGLWGAGPGTACRVTWQVVMWMPGSFRMQLSSSCRKPSATPSSRSSMTSLTAARYEHVPEPELYSSTCTCGSLLQLCTGPVHIQVRPPGAQQAHADISDSTRLKFFQRSLGPHVQIWQQLACVSARSRQSECLIA